MDKVYHLHSKAALALDFKELYGLKCDKELQQTAAPARLIIRVEARQEAHGERMGGRYPYCPIAWLTKALCPALGRAPDKLMEVNYAGMLRK